MTYVYDRNEHFWIDKSPDESQEGVEPFYALWGGRTEILSTLCVHIHPDPFELLFDFATSILGLYPGNKGDCANEDGPREPREPGNVIPEDD